MSCVAPAFFDTTQTTQQDVTSEQSEEEPVVSAGDAKECAMCKERFDVFWSEEHQDWMIRGAVRVGNAVYHQTCAPSTFSATVQDENKRDLDIAEIVRTICIMNILVLLPQLFLLAMCECFCVCVIVPFISFLVSFAFTDTLQPLAKRIKSE